MADLSDDTERRNAAFLDRVEANAIADGLTEGSLTTRALVAYQRAFAEPLNHGVGMKAAVRSVLAVLAEAAGDPEALGSAYTRAYYAQPQTDTGVYLGHHAGLQAVAAAAVAGVRAREVEPLRDLLRRTLPFVAAFDGGSDPSPSAVEILAQIDAALGGGDRGR